jgi:cyclopropane-fatty-acyl-phospholipid synthase
MATTSSSPKITPTGAATGVAAELAELVGLLDSRAEGGRSFTLAFWDGSELPPTNPVPNSPTLRFAQRDALVRMVREPNELGMARAWVSGELEVDGDLEMALDLTEKWRHAPLKATDAIPALKAARKLGLLRRGQPPAPEAEIKLQGRLHSAQRDQEAISHHYDVSNEFYRRMLGETMVYSCAYFGSPEDTLDQAQTRKLDLICKKLELKPGDRLLDIGCGWGSLMIYAAHNYGVHAVGVTISEEQAALARERIIEAGMQDQCEVRLQDYREVNDGPYDKISSVGMFEHVGRDNLPIYLQQARSLIAKDGLFLNHGIVRVGEDHQMHPKSFTQRYVFPDGELHTQGIVISAIESAGFELVDDESLRPHYAETLRRWAINHDSDREAAIAEIGPERERVWRLHNYGAALGFERSRLSVHQVIARPVEEYEPAPPLRVRSYPV